MLVKNTQKHVISLYGAGVNFYPGNNEVTDGVWTDCLKKELIKKRMEVGHLVVMSKGKKKSIGDMDVKGAKAIVAETFSVKVLDDWAERENRAQVLSAIEKQIAKVAPHRSLKEENLVDVDLSDVKADAGAYFGPEDDGA